MNRPKLPSQLHPEYPKGYRLKQANGVDLYFPVPIAWLQAFWEAHPEFDNEGEYEFQCPYCGGQLSEERNYCCGEAGHGEWVLEEIDPTPWCSGCGAMKEKNCHCGPIAEND